MYIFGIKGEKVDGNTFYEKALENGAKACILQDIDISNEILEKYKDRVILKVQKTREALKKIAEFKREMYDIPVVGVTGSVGKTSTKDLIASVMSKKYKTLKTEGNYNNDIGLPLTVLRLKDEEAAVIEMGMNHLGEISRLTKIAKPTIGVITNVGTAHIGNLGSRENILKAKLEILDGMKENAPLVINNDNDILHNWYLENREKRNIITFGIQNESNVMAKSIKTYEDGSEFEVEIYDKTYNAKVNVRWNSLCNKCFRCDSCWNSKRHSSRKNT